MNYTSNRIHIGLTATILCLSFLCPRPVVGIGEQYASPFALAMDKDGKTLYIAEYTAYQVAVFDIAGEKVLTTYLLPDKPTGLAIHPDGTRLYVTGESTQGQVQIVDLKSGKITAVPVGHTPNAPVVSPNGKMLYVCNRFDNSVSVIDLAGQEQVAEIAVNREPVAAAVTPDGKFLFVANLLPIGAADKDYITANVSIIDTAARKVIADVMLPNGSMSLRGICVSPDGKNVYVTHILARYQLPTTQLERGWMNTNALTIIDVNTKKPVNTVLLDEIDLGAANPWDVACTADGKYICVSHAGTHELSVIERKALHDKLEKVAAGEKVSDVSLSADDVPNDLAFLVGIRRRIKLKGNGPRGIALAGRKVFVAEYFTDTIGVVDIDPQAGPNARSIALGSSSPITTLRKGEILFNDATMCFQHWQSCATCHPDARNDGLNWDLLNDGMGNPKSTKSMLLAHKTPPAMVTGIRDKAETGVRSGIKFIQFAVRPEEDAVAIDEYLKSLEPVPSPHLAEGWFGKKGKLSKSAKRGRKLFNKAGCASCHSGSLYTDMAKYDVGTGKGNESGRQFDTPTLVEVWRTAPYLYDGRAETIKDVLTTYNNSDKHGETSGLNEKQIRDLAEFVMSQ
ncbi:MAG: beta-propeller fold lactonase family protein [Planctomycetota bacterium]